MKKPRFLPDARLIVKNNYLINDTTFFLKKHSVHLTACECLK